MLTEGGKAVQARNARGVAEEALDANGWWWSSRISHWIDTLVILEEHAG